jgi:hypothetical protein
MSLDRLQGIVNAQRAQARTRWQSHTLADSFASQAKTAKGVNGAVSAVMAYWEEQELPHLDAIESIEYKRGVLTLRVASSAAKFELDRILRSPDIKAGTIKASPVTLSRIRLRV